MKRRAIFMKIRLMHRYAITVDGIRLVARIKFAYTFKDKNVYILSEVFAGQIMPHKIF